MNWLWVVCLVLTTCGSCARHPSHTLLTHLLDTTRYDRRLTPNIVGQPITVRLGVALRQVLHLDERKQVMRAGLWRRQFWQDPYLIWDPADYNQTDSLALPHTDIWLPDIVLYNSAQSDVGSYFDDVIVTVTSEGNVTYLFPEITETSCTMDTINYPFDEQECLLEFGSWGQDGSNLDLQPYVDGENPADISHFQVNSEWGLVSLSWKRTVSKFGDFAAVYPYMTLSVRIRRRWSMYIFYLVLPTLFLNIITVLQFLLPADSSERMTLGSTLLLAMLVYLLLLAELLPMTESVPIMVQYLGATFFLVGLNQVLSIPLLQIHFSGNHDNHWQLPDWARTIILHWLARALLMDRKITADEEHKEKMVVPEGVVELEEVDDVDEDSTKENQSNGSSGGASSPPNVVHVEESSTSRTSSPMDERRPSFQRDRRPSVMIGERSFIHGEEKRTSLEMESRPSWVHRGSIASVMLPHRDHSVRIRTQGNMEYLLAKVYKVLDDWQQKTSEERKDSELKCEWQQVAMVIDRLFLYLTSLLTVVLWMYTYCHVPCYENPIIK